MSAPQGHLSVGPRVHRGETHENCCDKSDLGVKAGLTCWESSFSRLLKASGTKERPSGGTRATNQTYKESRSASVAASLPRVVNHGVCPQSTAASKPWERSERAGEGREGVVALSVTHG